MLAAAHKHSNKAAPPRQAPRPLSKLALAALALIALWSGANVPSATARPAVDGLEIQAPVAAPAAKPEAGARAEATGEAWLVRLNQLREVAKLPPVMEAPAWSYGCGEHAEYLVRNRTYGHYQSADNPWFTPAGAECGRSGNVISGRMSSGAAPFTQAAMVDAWMTAPFHGLGFINPGLNTVAFGEYAEVADGLRHWAATLDIMRGLAYVPPTHYPVMWPADGASVGLTRYAGNEYPDPLTSCHGYGQEAGLPILLLLGNTRSPQILASQVLQDGLPLEHCVLTETTYTNPDAGSQQLARAVMGYQGAVIIMPRMPLTPGASVSVSVGLTSGTHAWSFSIQR
jgi:hypothetical protein